MTEAQRRAQAKYEENRIGFIFKFRKDTDQKYIEFLKAQENRSAFLREAIDRELDVL
jgi:hypothetical protein